MGLQKKVERPLGSSPRARGRLHRDTAFVTIDRFIPACAGKAFCRRDLHSMRPVHPRVRGEGRPRASEVTKRGGSSPRARGRRSRALPDSSVGRFIPACAGKARACTHRAAWKAVHPRVRGEGYDKEKRLLAVRGSSPRARGRRLARHWPRMDRRFIPACAGKASEGYCADENPAVHPRVRGEGYPPSHGA